jgi:hypothetical protein
VFITRPWETGDVDPGAPAEVLGEQVIEPLRSRGDRPGSLVALRDGRYAVSGPTLIAGSATQVRWRAEARLRSSGDSDERAWWEEVIGALEAERSDARQGGQAGGYPRGRSGRGTPHSEALEYSE